MKHKTETRTTILKSVKVILYQKPLGITIPDKDIDEIKRYSPDFICFPEYFFVDQVIGNLNQTEENQIFQLNRIRQLSIDIDSVIIAGTMPELSEEKIYNTSFVYYHGEEVGHYRKKNLFLPEVGKITPGNEYKIFSVNEITFGVLICADVFHDESFQFMKENGAKIIFSPTFSLKKIEEVEEKHKRDREIYINGAKIADSVIVKVCGVKSEYKDFLQARSLIADKNKIIFRVKPEEEDSSLIIKKEILI